jgi:hypothetical protein
MRARRHVVLIDNFQRSALAAPGLKESGGYFLATHRLKSSQSTSTGVFRELFSRIHRAPPAAAGEITNRSEQEQK